MADLKERDLLDRLARRYSKGYKNGSRETLRYIFARHVRFGPLWPSCILDGLALDTWGNYGPEERRHPLIGFEVKTSRSDWLRELKEPGKSKPFREVCREFYLVVPDKGIVKDDLPEGWGLMVARGAGLAVAHASTPSFTPPKPMPRPLIAGFMRAAVTQAKKGTNCL